VVTVEEQADLTGFERLLNTRRGAVFISLRMDDLAPEGVEVVEVPLPPLGIANVRRTVVGFAPHTPEAAQVAAHLHTLSGGLPALLVPLLQAYTSEQKVVLPEKVPPPFVAYSAFENLADDTCTVAATLALLDRPASLALLAAVVGPTAEMAIEELESRGVVRSTEGQIVLAAEVFRTVALAVHPDISTLEAHVEAARGEDPTVPGATLRALCQEAERHLRDGRLRSAFDAAERASELATAVGERQLECLARATWGLVLLETGFPKAARRCLADATALARAVGDRALRHRTHLLRAWAEMDERPGDPGAAAAALDRLMPLVDSLSDDLSDPLSAFTSTLWARAAAGLGDHGTWRRAAEVAEARIAMQGGVDRARLMLLLAEGAHAVSDQSTRQRVLDAASTSVGLPLHAWWSECLLARVDATEPPAPADLTHLLQPHEIAALEKRSRRAGV
jgi:hypothetical protein